MSVTNYYTVNGEIISESTDGVYLDYLTDALGSVTAKVDQNCNVVSTARYKPYGDLLAGTQYKLGWVGTLGYRKTGLKYSGEYIRARHYSLEQGLWTNTDSLWPNEFAYTYALSNPIYSVDPTGRAGTQVTNCCESAGEITIAPQQGNLNERPYCAPDGNYDRSSGVKGCFFKLQVNIPITLTPKPNIKGVNKCVYSWKEMGIDMAGDYTLAVCRNTGGTMVNGWCEQQGATFGCVRNYYKDFPKCPPNGPPAIKTIHLLDYPGTKNEQFDIPLNCVWITVRVDCPETKDNKGAVICPGSHRSARIALQLYSVNQNCRSRKVSWTEPNGSCVSD